MREHLHVCIVVRQCTIMGFVSEAVPTVVKQNFVRQQLFCECVRHLVR